LGPKVHGDEGNIFVQVSVRVKFGEKGAGPLCAESLPMERRQEKKNVGRTHSQKGDSTLDGCLPSKEKRQRDISQKIETDNQESKEGAQKVSGKTVNQPKS